MTDVLDRKIQVARNNYQPLFSTIELTQTCNLKCKHCYNFDRNSSSQPNFQNLPYETAKAAVDGLFELGALSLALTGGEPLLYPQLKELVQYAMEKHFHIRIKSNATLLTQELAHNLFSWGVKEFDISLYGINEQQYLDFTGKRGFQKTIQGITFLKEAGIVVNLGIILHRKNVDSLTEFIELSNQLQLPYQISDEITDRYDKTQASESLGITQEQYMNLLKGPHKEFFNHTNKDHALMCGCAKTVIGIGHQGNVYPCIGSPILAGNINTNSLVDIWKESPVFNRIRNFKEEDFKECQKCELIESCSRSSGSAYINTGKFTGCDPQAKEFALARTKLKS